MPWRRCVGCRESKEKDRLVRFVARDGRLTIDRAGTLHGRGVYLCPSKECVDRVYKKRDVFSRSLRTGVSVPEKEELLRWMGITSGGEEGIGPGGKRA